MPSSQDVTQVLRELSEGHESAPERLMPLVYDELRKLAQGYMQGEGASHTLQATALVHEAYIRLVDWKNVSWQNRAHFFALAAQVMRHILVDHARAKRANKRSAGQKLALEDVADFVNEKELDLLSLEEALLDLERLDPRQTRIVELRFFGGLSIEETAHVLNLSETTVKREWTMAKAWFQRELRRS